ncbi:DUF2336 domain-containing protein [Paracraurococcus ruber]|uniref:DUF2336 domain-containing protein n=1 Tax=Paracraurococcus ruber TaxID=77675 RepID=A0ABS1CU00_9PROT|nr:DUF2336 domain-containing protein [Paracraurococcus ruber]MBK1657849.1 hypothetical protein [Paracraurococcus ruber]TDG33532.1 DUF2336 domain-containing protein [Paracraurococcus ruber]
MIDMPDYEAAKRVAAQGSEAERVALAGSAAAAPEILYFLANDPRQAVRSAVAGNARSPAQADRLLAEDQDPGIRAAIGRKLAPRAPELAGASDRLRRLAWDTLCRLAEDAAVTVRQVIAEELQAMPGAPRDLILRLAQDAAMEVAEPVIRFSPLLTEDDLLALVEAPPVPATVTAVARRPMLSERLSDAVAKRAEAEPVAALLANDSAAIRERTLDALIAQAATQPEWQRCLVRRPGLPPRALLALAKVVADHLLEPLTGRADLDPGLARLLRARVEQRLQRTEDTSLPPDLAFEEAALQGDRIAMRRLLAAAAGVPETAVTRAERLRNAKALLSLCWQAGLPPRAATLAQTVLGQIAPGALLRVPEDGRWPLSEDEMRWQIELLAEPETAA